MKKHVILVGASEVADTELLAEIMATIKYLDIIVCLNYEAAADMIMNAPADIAIIGKYTQSENQIGEADEGALKVCHQNSLMLIERCQQKCLPYVFVDTEKSPNWQWRMLIFKNFSV